MTNSLAYLGVASSKKKIFFKLWQQIEIRFGVGTESALSRIWMRVKNKIGANFWKDSKLWNINSKKVKENGWKWMKLHEIIENFKDSIQKW